MDSVKTAELACLDGAVTPAEEATIPVVDEGFIRGDGVFEVIRVYDGKPYKLAEHLDRLERSAGNLRLGWDVPRTELLAELDATAESIRRTMPTLTEDVLSRPFPQPIGGHTLQTDVFLTHMATHLAYHLGQIDYHRRVVTGDSTGVGAMAVGELPEIAAS